MFHLEGTDLWLTPTAEVELTSLYRNETADAETLPIKACAWTACGASAVREHEAINAQAIDRPRRAIGWPFKVIDAPLIVMPRLLARRANAIKKGLGGPSR